MLWYDHMITRILLLHSWNRIISFQNRRSESTPNYFLERVGAQLLESIKKPSTIIKSDDYTEFMKEDYNLFKSKMINLMTHLQEH